MTRKLLDCPLSCPRFRTAEELTEHLTQHASEELALAVQGLGISKNKNKWRASRKTSHKKKVPSPEIEEKDGPIPPHRDGLIKRDGGGISMG